MSVDYKARQEDLRALPPDRFIAFLVWLGGHRHSVYDISKLRAVALDIRSGALEVKIPVMETKSLWATKVLNAFETFIDRSEGRSDALGKPQVASGPAAIDE